MYFKFPWKVVPTSSVFLWTGIGSQVGLSFHRPNGLDITAALGTDTEQRNIDPITGEEAGESVLPGFARQFGAWAILSRDLKLSLGITHQWLGMGLGVGR